MGVRAAAAAAVSSKTAYGEPTSAQLMYACRVLLSFSRC
jgi:hypothetical protein